MSEKDDDNAGKLTILAAATSGDKLKLLITLRDRIAVQLEDCPIRDLSPLTIRLRDIVDEIEEIKERQRVEGKGKEGGSAGDGDTSGSGDGPSDAPWSPDDNV
jgi:hypothetical protein